MNVLKLKKIVKQALSQCSDCEVEENQFQIEAVLPFRFPRLVEAVHIREWVIAQPPQPNFPDHFRVDVGFWGPNG